MVLSGVILILASLGVAVTDDPNAQDGPAWQAYKEEKTVPFNTEEDTLEIRTYYVKAKDQKFGFYFIGENDEELMGWTLEFGRKGKWTILGCMGTEVSLSDMQTAKIYNAVAWSFSKKDGSLHVMKNGEKWLTTAPNDSSDTQ
jgi:hypothetical protein